MNEIAVEVLTAEQGRALFNSACHEVGIPPGQFLDAYDTGVAWSRWEHGAVTRLSMLIPFAR